MSNLMQFVQDDTRANSVKRLVFVSFAGVYIALCIVPLWREFTDPALYAFINSTQDKLATLVTWIGGMILAENVAPLVSKSVSKSV